MEPKQLHFEDRVTWREWLEGNFDSTRELWLVFFKKHTGVATISYDAAVEEALARNDAARLFFYELDPTYQRHFVLWVDSAKREKTRSKRLAEAMVHL